MQEVWGVQTDASLGPSPRAGSSPKRKRPVHLPAPLRAALGLAEDDPLPELVEQVWSAKA
jgi:hypothetical protein